MNRFELLATKVEKFVTDKEPLDKELQVELGDLRFMISEIKELRIKLQTLIKLKGQFTLEQYNEAVKRNWEQKRQ